MRLLKSLKLCFSKNSPSVKVRKGKREGICLVDTLCQEKTQSVKEREGKREGRNMGIKNPKPVKVREGCAKRNVKQIRTCPILFLRHF